MCALHRRKAAGSALDGLERVRLGARHDGCWPCNVGQVWACTAGPADLVCYWGLQKVLDLGQGSKLHGPWAQ